MADNSTDPNFPPPSLPPPAAPSEPPPEQQVAGPESAPATRRVVVPAVSAPVAGPVSAPISASMPTPRIAFDPKTLAPSDADIGGDTIDGLLGDLANERRPGYLAKQVRETAGHIAAAYNTSDAMAPAMPRQTDPPEAPVVLSDSLIMSRDLVPKAPPLDPDAVTQPIPKDIVAESVRRSPNAPAVTLADETPADAPPPTVPRRKLDDVGGETVLVARKAPRSSLDDRRRTLKWIVGVGTVTLGVFALVAFLVSMPNSSGMTDQSGMTPPAIAPAVPVTPTPVAVATEAPVVPPPPPPEEVIPPAATTAAPAAVTAAPHPTMRAPAPRPTARPKQPTGPRDDMKRTL
jgi:hypothetical protein